MSVLLGALCRDCSPVGLRQLAVLLNQWLSTGASLAFLGTGSSVWERFCLSQLKSQGVLLVVEARYAAKHSAGTGQLCAARRDLAPNGGSVEGETLP